MAGGTLEDPRGPNQASKSSKALHRCSEDGIKAAYLGKGKRGTHALPPKARAWRGGTVGLRCTGVIGDGTAAAAG